MPANSFNAASGQPTTTAGELAAELGRFAESLGKSAGRLREELVEMEKANGALSEELAFMSRSFVDKTLTGLEGDEFDTVAEIAQGVEELGSQGLAFYRRKLVTARDEALRTVNETLNETIDAKGFQNALAAATDTYEAAGRKAAEAQTVLENTNAALQSWEASSLEDDLVRLDQQIRERGGLSLTADNRAHYEPSNPLVAAFKWVFGGTLYREARRTLKEYGHNRDGKDAFADLANFREKYDGFNQRIAEAQASYDGAQAEKEAAEAAAGKLSNLAGEVRTDDQILEAIRDKVANDIKKSPEFIKALSVHYEEDFPRNLPLLVAKLTTLGKIQQGTEAKLESLQLNYERVTDQYQKLGRLRASTRVKGDLEAIRQGHDARAREYDSYTQAAGRSWRQTRDYAGTSGTAYADNSPGFFEMLLMYELLSDHDHHFEGVPQDGEFIPAADSGYTANLLGVDQESAEKLNLPDDVLIADETQLGPDDSAGLDEGNFDVVDEPDRFSGGSFDDHGSSYDSSDHDYGGGSYDSGGGGFDFDFD